MTPSAGWMARSPARVIAFGFGSGLVRSAPGTWGTLFGWASFVLLLRPLSAGWQLAVIAAAFLAGVWACGRTGRDLGVADHGGMVWDEVVAFWLVLAVAPGGWLAHLAAFGLFRLFDIAKPAPIRHVDQRLKGGFGVMLDDLLAAGYTLLVLAIWARITA